MFPLRRSPFHSGVFALALTAVALLISLLVHPYLEPNTFLLFIVAVWLSAWYYGRAGGALATGGLFPGDPLLLSPAGRFPHGYLL